jgi:beta-phosphoglucomutase-like phosphatase (HAD superfamily)
VEDSAPGIRSAKRAGMGKIIAIAPANKADIVKNTEEADIVISDFYEFDRGWLTN